MKDCVCGAKKIARGKYCDKCRQTAKRYQAGQYYARRGRRLRMAKRKKDALCDVR